MKRTPEEERIFRALAQIKTPEADLSAALRRAEEPRRIRPVRPLAAAAVLCALLTIGAAAVGFSGAWRYFVPPLPQNAVQTVGASQTSGNYTLTVEEAVEAVQRQSPTRLGLEGEDMEAYSAVPEEGVVKVDDALCFTVNVYTKGDHQIAGTYLITADGSRIYRLDWETGQARPLS